MLLPSLLLALIPTILIEYVVLWLLRERSRRILASSVLLNIITNIPLNLYLICISGSLLAILMGEGLVFLFEALWYAVFLRCLFRAVVYSFLCNATSFLTGLLTQLLYLYINV